MKTVLILMFSMSLGATLACAAQDAPSGHPTQQEPRHTEADNNAARQTAKEKTVHTQPLPKGRSNTVLPGGSSAAQSTGIKPGRMGAKAGPDRQGIAGGAHTSVQRNAARVTPAPAKNVRHRDANPAVVGGLSTTKPGGTGALSGNAMAHRP